MTEYVYESKPEYICPECLVVSQLYRVTASNSPMDIAVDPEHYFFGHVWIDRHGDMQIQCIGCKCKLEKIT